MDKDETLNFLCRIAEGIAKMFGGSCETLIQDMTLKNYPIIAIYNGYVSGRKVGSILNVYGQKFSENYKTLNDIDRDFINNLVINTRGRKIKSSTFNFKGKDYHYALGINYDFTDMFNSIKMQEDFMNVGSDLLGAIQEEKENRLSDIIDDCLNHIGKPVEKMTKTDRLRLVVLLKERHAFDFYKAVYYISERLGVSRYTIYSYLKQIK